MSHIGAFHRKRGNDTRQVLLYNCGNDFPLLPDRFLRLKNRNNKTLCKSQAGKDTDKIGKKTVVDVWHNNANNVAAGTAQMEGIPVDLISLIPGILNNGRPGGSINI